MSMGLGKWSLAAGFEALEDDSLDLGSVGAFTDSPPIRREEPPPAKSVAPLRCSSTSLGLSMNGAGRTTTTMGGVYDAIEEFIERRQRAEETNLIDLDDHLDSEIGGRDDELEEKEGPSGSGNASGRTWEWESATSAEKGNVMGGRRGDGLPTRAIIYDYTVQPIGVIERELRIQDRITRPFLRPILIDGVGLIKAFRGCCCNENNMLPNECMPDELHFPLMPIVRCLFYWISRGHRTWVCFPQHFSPIGSDVFHATEADKRSLKLLEKHGMAKFFDQSDSKQWFDWERESRRACLVTTVPHYLQGMPSNLLYCLSEANIRRQDREMCPDRLLQPFYDHKGILVFFSLFNNKNQCVESIVLDDHIQSGEEFSRVDREQHTFMEQVVQLKVLFGLLPRDARVREATVMVKLFGRLKPFL